MGRKETHDLRWVSCYIIPFRTAYCCRKTEAQRNGRILNKSRKKECLTELLRPEIEIKNAYAHLKTAKKLSNLQLTTAEQEANQHEVIARERGLYDV